MQYQYRLADNTESLVLAGDVEMPMPYCSQCVPCVPNWQRVQCISYPPPPSMCIPPPPCAPYNSCTPCRPCNPYSRN